MESSKDTKAAIQEWYQKSAPQAVLAELEDAIEYAERSGVTKVQAVRRFVDAKHAVKALLVTAGPTVTTRVAALEQRVSQLETAQAVPNKPKPSNKRAHVMSSAQDCEVIQ